MTGREIINNFKPSNRKTGEDIIEQFERDNVDEEQKRREREALYETYKKVMDSAKRDASRNAYDATTRSGAREGVMQMTLPTTPVNNGTAGATAGISSVMSASLGNATKDAGIRREGSSNLDLARMPRRNSAEEEAFAKATLDAKVDKKDRGFFDKILEAADSEDARGLIGITSGGSGSGYGQFIGTDWEAQQEANQAAQQLRKKYGDDFAKYIQYTEEIRDAEARRRQQKEIYDSTHTGNKTKDAVNAALYSAGSVVLEPLSGALARAEGFRKKFTYADENAPINTNSKYYSGSNFQKDVKNTVSERIDNQVGKAAYGLGMAGAEMGSRIVASAGYGALAGAAGATEKARNLVTTAASLSTMWNNVYSSSVEDAQNRGLDESAVKKTALYQSAAEVIPEILPMERLVGMAGKGFLKQAKETVVKELVKQGVIEGVEEGVTTVIDRLMDAAVNGDKSELNERIRALESEGYNSKDARRIAEKEWYSGLAADIAGGAILGTVTGSAAIGTSLLRNNAEAKEIFDKGDYKSFAEGIDTDEGTYKNTEDWNKAVKAQKEAERLADKQEKGEKITNKERRQLWFMIQDTIEAAQTNNTVEPQYNKEVYEAYGMEAPTQTEGNNAINQQDTTNNIAVDEWEPKIREYSSQDVPEDYRTEIIPAAQAIQQMDTAKTAEELVKTYQAAEKTEAVENSYNRAYGRMKAEGKGEALAQLEASPTQQEAYLAGVNGQEMEAQTPEIEEAYNAGKIARVNAETEAKKTEKPIGATVVNQEGEEFTVKGIKNVSAEDVTLETDKGDIQLSDVVNTDQATQKLYNDATNYNTKGARIFLEAYPGQLPVNTYSDKMRGIYRAGEIGTSFESALKDYGYITKYVSEEKLKDMYEAGREYGKPEVKEKKVATAKKAAGHVEDKRTIKDDRTPSKAIKQYAKKTGIDVEIVDSLLHDENGHFDPDVAKIVLNADADVWTTLLHEGLGEYLEAYNPEGFDEIQVALLEYARHKMGTQAFNERLDKYQRKYQEAEGSKTARQAANEMVNDMLSGLFSTEEGMSDFCNWLMSDENSYDGPEKQTILERIASFIQDIIDEIKRILDTTSLSPETRTTMEMEADKAAALRKDILAAMDQAIANRDAMAKERAAYEDSIDKWDGKDPTKHFTLGKTSDVLKNLGVADRNIVIDASKVLQILKKHKTMDIETIKQLPGLVNDPIIVMQSKSIEHPDRLVMAAELTDNTGKPVIAILELHPKDKHDLELDEIKVASAYGKDNMQDLMNTSNVLYITPNKKRANDWRFTTGLQLPVVSSITRPTHSISPDTENTSPKIRHSYAGSRSQYYPANLEREAERLEREGKSPEVVYLATGWFRGADGKWRYEIDDSKAEVNPKADNRKMQNPDYRRMVELENKFFVDVEEGTQEEWEELGDLQKTLSVLNSDIYLPDIISHDELFEAYPQLEDIKIDFNNNRTMGTYQKVKNTISLDRSLKSPYSKAMLKKTLLHEIQHAIQDIEGFAGGANEEAWEGIHVKVNGKKLNDALERRNQLFESMTEDSKAIVREYNRAKTDQNYDRMAEIEQDIYEKYPDDVSEYLKADFDVDNYRTDDELDNFQKYYRTAGEIEARDTEDRSEMNYGQRRETMPKTSENGDVLFVEGRGTDPYKYNRRYSINVDTDSEIKSYGLEEKINDYIAVQKAIIKKLDEEGFFEANKEIKNENTGNIITLSRGGMRETFGNGNNYAYKGRPIKEMKIATARYIPEIIKKASLDDENKDNKHASDGQKFDYYSAPISVNGKTAIARIAVKKGGNNKFWVHYVDIIEDNKEGSDSRNLPDDAARTSNANQNPTDIISSPKKKATEKEKKIRSLNKRRSINIDSDGNELTEAQEEFFKDSKARDEIGRLKVLYHQTGNDFTIFDTRREGAGTSDSETPFGIFLKSTDKSIGLKGEKQMSLYANITNPVIAENRADLVRQFRNMIDGYEKLEADLNRLDRYYAKKSDEMYDATFEYMNEWLDKNPSIDRGKIYDDPEYNRLSDAEDALLDEWKEKYAERATEIKEKITAGLEAAGYDGVILREDRGSFGRSTDAYIALRPDQVKNINNTNPTENPDIRYSINVDSEGEELTKEQQEFFKDSKVVDDEGNLQVVYHGTSGNFTVFDLEQARGTADIEAFFFTRDIEEAGGYGGNIGKYYLNIKNPADGDTAYDIFFKYQGQTGAGIKTREELQKMGYDGVISYDEDSPEYTEYLAFSPEQIKRTDNKKPTSNVDVRKSIKIGDETDVPGIRYAYDPNEYMPVYDGDFMDDLFNENTSEGEMDRVSQILSAANESLRGHKVDESVINNIARVIKTQYGSSIRQSDLADNLKIFFEYMQDNGDLNYNDMMRVLTQVTYPVIENSGKVDPVQQEKYERFKNYLKGTKIKLNDKQAAEIKHVFGSVAEFKKMYRGILNISKDGESGIGLDQIWDEVQEASDGFVQSIQSDRYYGSDSDANMPIVIAEAIDLMKPEIINTYGQDQEQAALDLSMDIMRRYYDATIKQIEEDKAVETIKNSGATKEALKTAKTRLARETNAYRKATKEEYDARLKEAEEKAEKAIEEGRYWRGLAMAAEGNKEAIAEERKQWKAKEAELRQQLKQVAKQTAGKSKSLVDYLDAQEKEKNKRKIMQTANRLMRMTYAPNDTQHMPEVLRKPVGEFLKTIDFTSHRARPGSKEAAKWHEKMRDLAYYLSSLDDMEDPNASMISMIIDDDLINDMDTFAASKKQISRMNNKELKDLADILQRLSTAINKSNETFANERYKTVDEMAKTSIMEIQRLKNTKEGRAIVMNARDFFTKQLEDPVTYFESLGPVAATNYKALLEGFDLRSAHIKEMSEYMEDVTKGVKDMYKWSTDKLKVGDVEMTVADAMSLYELVKREQARPHLLTGGIKIETVLPGGRKNLSVDEIHLGYEGTMAFIDQLTDEQKRVADAMQKFMAENCATWGNRTSMKLFGYEKFKDPNYFPIKTDSKTRATNNREATNNQSLFANKNFSATKELTQMANNTIIIGDIFDTFADHVTDMATYDGMVLPQMDAMRWFNFTEVHIGASKDGEIKNYNSVRKEIQRTMGEAGNKYFTNLMLGINGMEPKSRSAGFISNAIGRYKKVAVMAKVRVAIQQPTAMVRALDEMKGKYLSKALASTNPAKYSKIAKEKSMLAWWKGQGYYETYLGKNVRDMIVGKNPIEQAAEEAAGWGAQTMDDLTWGVLYHAAEYEIEDTTDLKPGTKEFDDAVVSRFEDVVTRTQVVDTMLHRTDIMRNNNELVKMATSFMAEPLKTYNMLLRSFMKLAEDPKNKKAIKRVMRALLVYILNNAVLTAVTTTWDAFRKDDDKTAYMDRWYEIYRDTFIDNINPVNMIPVLKDVVDIFSKKLQGDYYSGTDMTYDGIEKVGQFMAHMSKRMSGEKVNKTDYGLFMEGVQAGSILSGKPVYNVLNDLEGIYNGVFENLERSKSTSEYADLKDAISKDGNVVEEVKKLKDDGKEEKNIKSAITRNYKDEYLAITDKTEKANMKNTLIKAYMAAGDTREEAAKKIDKWSEN